MELIKIKNALVLKKVDFGEADRIITVFTKEEGLLSLLIKGIRKSKKRSTAASDLITISDFVLYKKKDMYTVSSINSKEMYLRLKEDFFKINIVFYILKLLNLVLVENEEREKIHKLTLNTINYIEKEDTEEKIYQSLNYFLLKVLEYEGIGIKKEAFEKGFEYFNLERACFEREKSSNNIFFTEKQKKLIYFLNIVDISKINELKLRNSDYLFMISFLEKYIKYHLDILIDIKRFTF